MSSRTGLRQKWRNTLEKPSDIRSLKIALIAYIIVFTLKLVVYFMTGVMAILAESLHTLSDIFVSGFLLAAIFYSRRQADDKHMFGYGRAQNIAALVAATLFISFTAYKLFEESIPRLFRPEAAEHQNLGLAVGVILVSMIIAAVPLLQLKLQKDRGPAARAQFLESINDEFGLIAALVGTLFIISGSLIADPIASLVVAILITYNGIKLFKENWSSLLGRSPNPEYLARVEQTARGVPGVLGIHDLRAEIIGPDIVHAGLHIEVAHGTPIEEADRLAREVRERIHAGGETSYCYIHVDPTGMDK